MQNKAFQKTSKICKKIKKITIFQKKIFFGDTPIEQFSMTKNISKENQKDFSFLFDEMKKSVINSYIQKFSYNLLVTALNDSSLNKTSMVFENGSIVLNDELIYVDPESIKEILKVSNNVKKNGPKIAWLMILVLFDSFHIIIW